jgi:apolipoprotein N-acyltransferase
MKEWLPIGKLAANAGDFVQGPMNQPLLIPPESHLKLGPLICYEDTFSRESVRQAKSGANALVNITNDAWYGNTSAQAQHTAMAQLMVYSTRLPMVRATNNGLSTLITTDRREDLPAFSVQKGSFPLEVFENPAKTFFVWTYPLMEWIWLVIFVIAVLWKESRQTKKIFFRR